MIYCYLIIRLFYTFYLHLEIDLKVKFDIEFIKLMPFN